MTRDDGWSSRIEKRSPGGPLARHAATFLFSRSLGSRSGLIDFDFGGFFWMGRVLFFVFDFLSSRRRLWPSDSVARVSFDWQLLRFFLVQIKIKSCFAFSFFYFWVEYSRTTSFEERTALVWSIRFWLAAELRLVNLWHPPLFSCFSRRFFEFWQRTGFVWLIGFDRRPRCAAGISGVPRPSYF